MFGADCVTNATGEPLLNLVVGWPSLNLL
jgi:hypothetical protein